MMFLVYWLPCLNNIKNMKTRQQVLQTREQGCERRNMMVTRLPVLSHFLKCMFYFPKKVTDYENHSQFAANFFFNT